MAILLYFGLFALTVAAALWRLPDRRVGTEPHCASCGYCLVGAPGPLCPECGCEIKYNIVHGQPVLTPTWRRLTESLIRIAILVGIAAILFSLIQV
jgi:hypothetical protein